MKDDRVWNEAGMWSKIERYRKEQRDLGLKGRCKEKALLRSMGLQKAGYNTRVGTGKYKGTKHTWLEVEDPKTGLWFVDDPSQGIQHTGGYVLAEVGGYERAGEYEYINWEIKDEASKQAYLEQNRKKT